MSAIARQPKAPPIDLIASAEVAPHEGRIARELAALALVAIAAWMLLSLLSINLDWQPNRGGPLGAAAASLLAMWFGYQAYVVIVMVAVLGLRAWAARGWSAIFREATGGAIVILALSAIVSPTNTRPPGHEAAHIENMAKQRGLDDVHIERASRSPTRPGMNGADRRFLDVGSWRIQAISPARF